MGSSSSSSSVGGGGDYATILWRVEDGGVGVLTLNRPEKRNALDTAMREELAGLLPRIRRDATVKAVVITGAGGAFCAGGDLAAFRDVAREGGAVAIRERIREIHTWFPELLNLEKPVIAAVDGAAFGGGFMLALAADFVLASERARFCCVFPRVGLVPDLGAFWLLPRILGLQRAKEIALTGRTVGVAEAKSLGLVLEIHPPERLLDRALAFARRFRSAPTAALGMAKQALNQSFNLDQRALGEIEACAQAIATSSPEHGEAVDRFLARQPLAFDWDRMDREEGAPPR